HRLRRERRAGAHLRGPVWDVLPRQPLLPAGPRVRPARDRAGVSAVQPLDRDAVVRVRAAHHPFRGSLCAPAELGPHGRRVAVLLASAGRCCIQHGRPPCPLPARRRFRPRLPGADGAWDVGRGRAQFRPCFGAAHDDPAGRWSAGPVGLRLGVRCTDKRVARRVGGRAGGSDERLPTELRHRRRARPRRPRRCERRPAAGRGNSATGVAEARAAARRPGASRRADSMTTPASRLGVGIIGVNPTWGWAATAHIPALRALPNYEVRALSASSPEAARGAGEAFGVAAVFSDHEQLVAQPDVDVVAVTVKVPHHRELVSAALAAGKAVYCEWPLGRDLNEARAMATLAAEKGVRTVVGLQARQAPAIEFVRQLLSDGYVGEVLSTTMIGVSVAGDVVVQPNVYMLDANNGANLLTVAFGHSLDTLNFALGEFADLSSVSAIRRPLITAEKTREQIVKTAPDQVAVIGTLTSGVTASVHVREAVAGGTGFLWEINGTDGTLRITADAALPEIFPLTVAGARGGGEPTELAAPGALIQKWPTLS